MKNTVPMASLRSPSSPSQGRGRARARWQRNPAAMPHPGKPARHQASRHRIGRHTGLLAPKACPRLAGTALLLLLLAGCASTGTPPPDITLDDPQPVTLPDPPKPVQIVPVPEPLPLPGQLKPLHEKAAAPANPVVSVEQANREARMAPTKDGFINAIQTWPYTEGALYQIYASPGRVTLVQLQAGEKIVDVSAGDTVRWIVGDSSSGRGDTYRQNLQIKPVRAGLKTNLVVTTNRRIYLLELTSTEDTWMASVSWSYPEDELAQLKARNALAQPSTVMSGVSVDQLHFRYTITGDSPPWRPLRAFDDGQKVYIQFPAGIAQTDLPPLFLVGPDGSPMLVNYQYRAPYYVVDRLFGAVELRLGDKNDAKVVRISRSDGQSRGVR